MSTISGWTWKYSRLPLQLGPAVATGLLILAAWPTIWPLVALMAAGLAWAGLWLVLVPAFVIEPERTWKFSIGLLRRFVRAGFTAGRKVFDELFGDLIAEARRNREVNRSLAAAKARYDTARDWDEEKPSRVPGFCLAWAIAMWALFTLICIAGCLFVAAVALCPRCTDPSLLGVAREYAPTTPAVDIEIPALAPETTEAVKSVEPEETPSVISSTATITTPAPMIGIVATGTPTPVPTPKPETTTAHVVVAGDTIWTILTKWLGGYPNQMQIYCVLWTNDLHREGLNGQPVVLIHPGNAVYLPEFCRWPARSLLAFEDPREGGRVMLVVPDDSVYAYFFKQFGPGNFQATKLWLGYVPLRIGGAGFVREGLFQHTSPLTFVVSFTVEGMGEEFLSRKLNFEEEVPTQ